MKFSKRTLLLAASIVLCMTMTALGTIAYLTDRASVANVFTVGNINIFVDEKFVDEDGKPIEGAKLVDHDNNENTPDKPMTETEYEAWVEEQKKENPDGEYPDFETLEDSNGRTQYGNEYKLVPGMTYEKDPTMTVKAGSEEAYVRMAVTINKIAELKAIFGEDFLPEDFVEDWDSAIWPCVKMEAGAEENTMVYYFNYQNKVEPSEADQVLEPLFTKITIPETVKPEQLATLQGLRIEIEGYAIQTAAFNDNVDAAWAAFDAQY